MDHHKAMEIYVEVVRARSYAAAARQLGISRANATKYVAGLESHLGARLLNRTTRRVSLTEVGEDYYRFCQRILGDILDKEAQISRGQEEARGTLRVMAPKSFGSLYMGALVSGFVARHPDIGVSLFLADVSMRSVDLVESGFDLALRLTAQADSRLVSRRIGAARWVLCAAPAYLAAHGRPRTPGDLKSHPCLLHSRSQGMPLAKTWRLKGPDRTQQVKVRGPIAMNSVMALRDAALQGRGLALLPTYCVGRDLAEKTLTEVLPGYEAPEEKISILFPHRGYLPAKARLFIDFAAGHFRDPPWERDARGGG